MTDEIVMHNKCPITDCVVKDDHIHVISSNACGCKTGGYCIGGNCERAMLLKSNPFNACIPEEPCPKCRTNLVGGNGGSGVQCPNPECDYWFCY